VVVIDSQAFLAAHATEAFSSPPTFLVEACITVPGGSGTMYSGYLWRENVGGVHPTADWYPTVPRNGETVPRNTPQHVTH
jgi:hypothetical protein